MRRSSKTCRLFAALVVVFLIPVTSRAGLITSSADIPQPQTVIDFSQFQATSASEATALGHAAPGPVQIGTLADDVQWTGGTTTGGTAMLGNPNYGLCSDEPVDGNGSWSQARNGFSGLGYKSGFMTYTFSTPVAAVGGFMNYARCSGNRNPVLVTVKALDVNGMILESYNLVTDAPIITPGQVDAGAFRGIVRATADIAAFMVTDGWVVLDDLTFSNVNTDRIQLFPSDKLGESNRRLLLSREASDTARFSSGFQTQNGKMLILGKTLDGQLAGASQDVYLRIVDPKDRAAYAFDAANADNRGGIELQPVSGTPLQVVGPDTYKLTSRADGTFQVTAAPFSRNGNPPAAGDNFYIEASFDPSFACAATCPRSGEITLWKRIYLEQKRMFRKGSFITAPGKEVDWKLKDGTLRRVTQVTVEDQSKFAVNDRVMLIHGAPKSGGPTNFYFDEATVLGLPRKTKDVVLDKVLGQSFGRDPDPNALDTWGDAMGVVTGNAGVDYYEADPRYTSGAFASMYVEIKDAPQKFAAFPYYVANRFIEDFEPVSRKWFENATHAGAIPQALANHIFVVGATQTVLEGQSDMASCLYTQDEGMTAPARNLSAVFVQRIEQLTAAHFLGVCVGGRRLVSPLYGLSSASVSGEVTVHEVTHQFSVNAPNSDGHCGYRDSEGRVTDGYPAYDSPPGGSPLCLMTPVASRKEQSGDGIVHFHYLSRNDSEYMTIRGKADPLP